MKHRDIYDFLLKIGFKVLKHLDGCLIYTENGKNKFYYYRVSSTLEYHVYYNKALVQIKYLDLFGITKERIFKFLKKYNAKKCLRSFDRINKLKRIK